MNRRPPCRAGVSPESLAPYLCILAATVLAHGFILSNDGTIWDSWYVLNFLQTGNWTTLHEFFGAVGIPFYGWLYRPFALLPDIVAGFMWMTLFCLYGSAVLTYRLAIRLGQLTSGEALVVSILALTMPLFSAAQDLVMFFFIFTHMLFLIGASLSVQMLDSSGGRRRLLRALMLATFYLSFTNSALLAYYGCFYVLFFLRQRESPGPFVAAQLRAYVSKYPDLLLLPPATWAARPLVSPQYGWYEHYNSPIANIADFVPNFLSFFENALPYVLRQTAAWPNEKPIAAAALVVAAVLAYHMAPSGFRVQRSTASSGQLAVFGCGALLLAVLPYAAAGKPFLPEPTGEASRYSMLTGLPLAILCLALLRLLFLRRSSDSRWVPAICGVLAVVLGSQIASVYLHERAEWIFSRALLHRAVNSEEVSRSSIVLLQGFSLVRQDAYGVFGFATEFGAIQRLVTSRPPQNGQYYSAPEIEKLLVYTTFLPANFRRIDPSGQQVFLEAERTRAAVNDWEVVAHYLHLRYLGSQVQLNSFFESLVSFKAHVLKPATELSSIAAGSHSRGSIEDFRPGQFENGAGMRLIRLPAGWWASQFETTQAQFMRVMGYNPSLFVDPRRPVDSVSWNEATAFCNSVTEMEAEAARLPEGFVYRLPKSQEFDYFAREASLRTAVISTSSTVWHTQPVGSFPPDRTGLHDVYGNVWEWSLDWGDRAHRVKLLNGGSWVDTAQTLSYLPASGVRPDPAFGRAIGPIRKDYPDQSFWNRGFRCILAGPAKEG